NEAMPLERIIEALGLEREISARPRTFAVYPCSALTGQGVDEPWQWMSDRFQRKTKRKNK
ncbi:MAG: hypothetical protein ACFFAU_06480, partial [Candidatus Hodarchaeota archaeon]